MHEYYAKKRGKLRKTMEGCPAEGGTMMRAAVTMGFWLLYWGMCFLATGTDRKNLMGLRSYPEAVQERVRREPSLAGMVRREPSLAAILGGNLALKGVLGLDSYGTAFWFFLVLWEGLGLFDLVVIDLLWWRHTKRVRFRFLPEKAYYQDPGKHVGSFLRGIPLFAAVAALAAGIVTAL